MGAWGTAIFSDDTACDIRDEWRDAILDRDQAEDATARLLDGFADLGDSASAKQRERVLRRLGEKLRGPQPKPKRLRRPVALSVPFEVGDVVRVHDPDDESEEALVVVVGHQRHARPPEELDPIIAAFDWDGGPVPDREALARLALVVDPITRDRPLIIQVVTAMKKDEFGPHVGDLVANGVTVDVAFDPDRVDRHMGWRVVPSAVHEARLVARWRATPEGRGD